jgi:hypothetical protein
MSSALAAASLILKPEGYSEGTLESLKPIDRSGDFTFTRGSNLSATRVNSAGLIEKGRENLLLQSNQFDTTPWSDELLGSLLGGQSGYDGSNDAWLLTKGEYQYRRVLQPLSPSVSGIWTFSVYAKEGTASIMNLRDMTNAYRVEFDLSGSGSVSAEFGNIVSKIESVGNGWFRCSATFNSSCSSIAIYVGWNDSTVSNIYIQDAQLEVGMVATDYIETGASTVKAGILENTPRLDYSGGATEPSLLLEPQRTNLVQYSEGVLSLPQGSATKENDFTQVSPTGYKEGVVKASNLQGATGDRVAAYTSSITGGNAYSSSMYIKGTEGETVSYQIKRSGGTYAGSDVKNITFDGTWQRIEATFTSLPDNTGVLMTIINSSEDNADVVYIWGVQIEEGSYATSYIPTYGSSETRSKDSCEKDGFISNGITTSSNFTFYMELEGLGQNGNPQVYLEDVSENRILSLNLVGQKNRYGFYSPDASNYVSTTSHEADGVVKIAVTYDGTNFKEYFNGVEKGTLAASVTVNMDRINFNKLSSNSIAVYKAILFPTALSNADCITLTTL